MQQTIILASGSPRRVELMRQIGLPIEAVPVDVDEQLQGEPAAVVRALALRKAQATYERFPDRYILAADTLVHIDGRTLGKPHNAEEAKEMLRMLSGKRHEVHTGVCLLKGKQSYAQSVCTMVQFTQLSEQDITAYVNTGEPMDKAGAYAVQGIGGMFVQEIHGSPSNVIGLPLHTVRQLLLQAGYYEV